jgi:DNA-3-methyladenine glycosylase II
MSDASRLTPDLTHEAVCFLNRSCPVMSELVTLHGTCSLPGRAFHPFQTLATSIISQQLSAKAATTIECRVRTVIPGLTPEGLSTVSPEALRAAGLSTAKVRYLKDIAHRVNEGRLELNGLLEVKDDDVITKLTEIPGIGRWTAEMFLIFGLSRPDILSLGDAGLQRAARILFGADAELERIAEAWKPYRSVASWYLWKHLDSASKSCNQPPAASGLSR